MKGNKHQIYKKNCAVIYVGSSLKVHNPLFSVGKLWRNKLMGRFYWSIRSKWWECRLNFVHRQVHKDIWQRRLTGFIHPFQVTNYGKTCKGKKQQQRVSFLCALCCNDICRKSHKSPAVGQRWFPANLLNDMLGRRIRNKITHSDSLVISRVNIVLDFF